MKRVLFVDDEPRVLSGIENILFDHMDQWDVHTAKSGAEALDMIDSISFDVLVTDMRMPRMNGDVLLEHVRANFPNMICFVLSGHAKTGAMLRALSMSHRYLSKPCNPGQLLSALQSASELIDITHVHTVHERLDKLHQLPPSPALFLKLQELVESGDTDFKTLAAVIEGDAVIAARLLQVANSAFFSRGRHCYSIENAVSRLGYKTLKSLLLGIETSLAFSIEESAALNQVRQKFLDIGCIARLLVQSREHEDLAFTGGILQGIGQLVFLSTDASCYTKVLKERSSQVQLQREMELYQVQHRQLGAYLLSLWGFDLEVIELVAGYEEEGAVLSKRSGVAYAVRLATLLYEDMFSSQGEEGLHGPRLDAKLGKEEYTRVCSVVESYMKKKEG